MNTKEKYGISLIFLIITIIIIIILSGAVIIELIKYSTIEKAKEAKFKNSVFTYNSEILNYLSNSYIQSGNDIDLNTVDASTPEDMKKIITITDEDALKFNIIDGKLVYIGNDENEQRMFDEINIASSGDMSLPVSYSFKSRKTSYTTRASLLEIETYESENTFYTYTGNWKRTNDVAIGGSYSYTNNDIGDNGTSSTTFNMEVPNDGLNYNLYFDYFINCEGCDYFRVYINGKLIYTTTGTVTSYLEKPLDPGNNVILLQYSKDYSLSVGKDAVFIDNLQCKRGPLIAPRIDTAYGTKNIANVTIDYPSLALSKEYSIDGVTWKKYLYPFDLSFGTTIYARYFMSAEEQSPISSKLIAYDSNIENYENIDTLYTYSGDWIRTFDGAISGRSSFMNKDIGDNGMSSTTFDLEVPDNGFNYNLYFDYLVSCEGCDYFRVYINGKMVLQTTGNITSYLEKPLEPGNNVILLKYSKDSSLSAGKDSVFIDNLQIKRGPLTTPTIKTSNYSATMASVTIDYPILGNIKQYSLDEVTWKNYSSPLNINFGTTVYAKYLLGTGEQSPITSLVIAYNSEIETYENPNMLYTYTGDWIRTFDSAISGRVSYTNKDIGDSEVSNTTFNVEVPDNGFNYNLYFDYVVSCEGCDYFRVYINGKLVLVTTGNVSSYLEKTLEPGNNVILLKYSKDSSLSVGKDAVFIDNLQYKRSTLLPTPNIITNSNNVTINYPALATIKQYSIDGVTWKNYETVFNINAGTTVYARYFLGTGEQSPIASLIVAYDSNIETYERANTIYTYTGDWLRTTDLAIGGIYSYTNKDIGDGQTSSTTFNVEVPSNGFNYNLYFNYIINCEGCDYFKVYINGTIVYNVAGSKTSYVEKPLKPGNNVIVLKYSKDSSISVGRDAVFVDDLEYKIGALIAPTITSTNGSVTINYPTLAGTKQYSIDGTTWQNYTSEINVPNNTTVYARYYIVTGGQSPISSMLVKF